MLDAEAVVEAELVAQLQFAPQLFVALVRRHAWLAPDVREMSEFHCTASSFIFFVIPGRTEGANPESRHQLCAAFWIPGPALRAVPE
jgi:hypothetical protein